MLCELLNVKHISGRPSSARKPTIHTKYITSAERALAAMTLVKQATTKEMVLSFGSDQWSGLLDKSWMDGYVWYRSGGTLENSYDSQQQYANSGSKVQLARHPSENLAREKWQRNTLEE